ncbi:methylated-DNA--[protein]-cysteine S-methyltransferase [Microbacterium sp.]|uniref:methylated-DNA--[protein]-cysteine S-methyltransferase n=1 Tax=Microbacterium sp. TaxID=51671 RepID=UPI0033407BD4
MDAFAVIDSPVGAVGLESDGRAVTRVFWPSPARAALAADPGPLLSAAADQLRAYFSGDLTSFDLPFDLGEQSEVTRAVLGALYDTVRHGECVTYGELAARSGTEVPARAIGSIMGANPIPLIVPCHRVVASDGLGGYSGGAPGEGLATKRWLLEHEGVLPRSLF